MTTTSVPFPDGTVWLSVGATGTEVFDTVELFSTTTIGRVELLLSVLLPITGGLITITVELSVELSGTITVPLLTGTGRTVELSVVLPSGTIVPLLTGTGIITVVLSVPLFTGPTGMIMGGRTGPTMVLPEEKVKLYYGKRA